MGISRFSQWIDHYLPNCVTNTIPALLQHTNNNVYFDCSYLLYFITIDEIDFTAKENMTTNVWKNIAAKYVCIFLQKIDECINKLQQYICLQQIYLVFDGVAPAAKLVHQRRRRQQKDNDLYTIFTTGTILMDMFTVFLRNALKSNAKYVNYSLNSCMKRGEGEIKLIDLVQQNQQLNNKLYHLILSPDTDLVIITLLRNIKQVILFNNYLENSRFVNLDIMCTSICQILLKDVQYLQVNTLQQVIVDFCFLTFFLGNDFIPRREYITFVKSYFNHIFTIYQNMLLHGMYLVDVQSRQINWINYTYLLSILNEKEKQILYRSYPQCKKITEVRDQWNEAFDFTLFSMRKWSWNSNDHTIACVCKRYLLTMQWIMYYWSGLPCSNFYYYPYDKSPLLYDLYTYFNVAREQIHDILILKLEDESNIIDFITPEYNILLFSENNNWYFTTGQQKLMQTINISSLKHINYKKAYMDLQKEILELRSYSDTIKLPNTIVTQYE